ncbi:alpha/beta hydrolase family protein [Rufibacter roseus]|uniref:Alpha/beta hydrolase family protein n=1 Tax=Rufibacter roseus TaxID=1567108 RepID=A0ABW2DM36_9BACT|nr:acetylxylan esterase [Rufibacter roseus]
MIGIKKSFKSTVTSISVAVATLLGAPSAYAQSPGPVLTWKAKTTYNAYLVRNLHAAYDQRRQKLEDALGSAEKMRAYQAEVKKAYLDVLGPFPEKQPLNAKVTGQIKQNGYRIENLVYESRPNHHVTANLYIPVGKGPFPAVLLMNGHEMTAKATESYQQTARLFASNGFVVLSVDPFSQGERVQLTDKNGKSLTRGATTEHTLLNAGANLVGTSVAAYMLWDNVRALDYLETRPEVDKTKLGAIGNSGGGTQAVYLLAYDDRIKVAAPASYFTQRARYIELAGAQDGCQYMPGEGSLEMADFIIAAAPKPVLILAGENDFVDHRGTLKGFEELKEVYTALQQPEKAQLFIWPDGHGISKPKREAAVSWFRKWLYQDPKPVQEGAVGSLSEQKLLATSTGQVNTAFPNEVTVQSLNHARFQQLASQRQAFMAEKNLNILRDQVKEVIGLELNSSPVYTEVSGTSNNQHYTVEKRILMRQGELPVPVVIYSPTGKAKPRKVTIALAEEGMASLLKTDSLIQQEMQAGNVLVLADLRGFGESQDDPKLNESKYWSGEYRNAILSLHLKKPLLTQRVQDLVSVLDYLKAQKQWAKMPVHITADGAYGPVVTHATFLDDRISKANIKNAIASYESFVANPLQKDMYSHVVQGLLQFYDLPDLVKRSNGRIHHTQL